MRLWSIHPRYLDPIGLIALWREALLAQAVLFGATRGYKNHPQLWRFQQQENPLISIGAYLEEVFNEAKRRGYSFEAEKIRYRCLAVPIFVTAGQIQYEFIHLKQKLLRRNPSYYAALIEIVTPDAHPLFQVQAGAIEPWEKISTPN